MSRKQLKRLPIAFWGGLFLAFVITLGRYSEAFLVLKGQEVGLGLALVPLVYVGMNIAYSVSAYPAGVLSDKVGRQGMLSLGLLLFVASNLVLALAPGLWGLAVGVVLWGLHLGFVSGTLDALVADRAPEELRGTAFGLYNLAMGVGLLIASLVAGVLWDEVGSGATFMVGAAFSAVALAGLLTVMRNGKRSAR